MENGPHALLRTSLASFRDPDGIRARRPSPLAVDVAAVAQSQDQHQKPIIMHLIEHAVGTHAQAQESRKPLERLGSGWSWLFRQACRGLDQTELHSTLESF